ncbi:DUF494 family protein, partial [Salmonella enterica]|uniref:DUF494 family protein n=1 Tax=Salmonella enterica TaxID=28901 RepID=UPI001CB863E0
GCNPTSSKFIHTWLRFGEIMRGSLRIERVLALDTAEFDLEDLKWVILMVLFNIPGCENAYQQMEELLFEVNEGMLH